MNKPRQGIGRRHFLRLAGGVGTALASPPLVMTAEATRQVTDPTELGAAALSSAIREREVSCVEVMQAYLARIARYNGVYNAIVSLADGDDLLAQAAFADRELAGGRYRGWMHGMPHAVKDLANAKGLPTSGGSPLFAGTMPDEDDLPIARLRAAGAIFIGKTNTPEFGYGSQTYNRVFGRTRNAWDATLTAGGSSGGAAVGLATQLLPVADGSDMMGSLRNPAGYNNVVGYRPSQGRVPDWPATDVWYQQLATSGPMGRNVGDTIRLLGTMAGYDPRVPLSRHDALPDASLYRARPARGLQIGWLGSYGGHLATEPGVLELCERALVDFSTQGAAVADCRPDYDMERLWQTWLTLRHFSALWARELYDDPASRTALKPELVWEIEGGLNVTGGDLHAAGIARSDWYAELASLLEDFDVLALPSAQLFPFPVEIDWPDEIAGKKMDTYHRWMEVVIGGTLSGLPVVNLPAGFDSRGRPMGMQFIGRMGEDRALLEFALAWEAATDYLGQRPVLRETL